jgi:hypothetical protein
LDYPELENMTEYDEERFFFGNLSLEGMRRMAEAENAGMHVCVHM